MYKYYLMTKNNCQELLFKSLNDYYNRDNNYKKIFNDIISGKHKLSLRLIDWLVTHYARDNNIYYWHDKDTIYYEMPSNKENIKKINVYLDYRAQLKSYTKLYFDTFRRHERISFYIDNDKMIETTLGQLNFFRWIFNNNILLYAEKNYESIYNNMIDFNKNNKKIKKNNNKQHIINIKSILTFN
jgi:hypothetical protein